MVIPLHVHFPCTSIAGIVIHLHVHFPCTSIAVIVTHLHALYHHYRYCYSFACIVPPLQVLLYLCMYCTTITGIVIALHVLYHHCRYCYSFACTVPPLQVLLYLRAPPLHPLTPATRPLDTGDIVSGLRCDYLSMIPGNTCVWSHR